MNKPSVKLELTFDADIWATLVEYSVSLKDKTPAATVDMMVMANLKVFLHGKTVGMVEAHEGAMKAIERIGNTHVLP